MTLEEVIVDLERFDERQTIYSRGILPHSECLVEYYKDDDEGLPPESAKSRGMEYFLEVDLANEVIEVWSQWRDGRIPTNQEKVEAVLFYAKWDAYIPVE